MAPIFFRGAHGAVIVFDVTNRDSFNRATQWFKELNEFTEGKPQIILVGNKIDLPNREITNEEATQLAKEFDCEFIEVSALLGTNIDEIFYSLAKSIHQQRKNEKIKKKEMENQYIEMNENKENTTKKRMKLNIVSNNENETISSKRKGECC